MPRTPLALPGSTPSQHPPRAQPAPGSCCTAAGKANGAGDDTPTETGETKETKKKGGVAGKKLEKKGKRETRRKRGRKERSKRT